MRTKTSRSPNIALGAAAGAIAGVAASWAMVRFNHALGNVESDSGPHQHRRRAASPNDIDGTISDEPGSIQVASAVAGTMTDAPLDERQKAIGGSIVHYLFGAGVGSLYGAASEYRPETAALAGVPFGVAVWIAADEIGLPVAGFARSPVEYPASRHMAALASHVVFGLATEGVRRLLRSA
jgi:Protein of unknown function (DUF1440)